jgi:hypothetical protein
MNHDEIECGPMPDATPHGPISGYLWISSQSR